MEKGYKGKQPLNPILTKKNRKDWGGLARKGKEYVSWEKETPVRRKRGNSLTRKKTARKPLEGEGYSTGKSARDSSFFGVGSGTGKKAKKGHL